MAGSMCLSNFSKSPPKKLKPVTSRPQLWWKAATTRSIVFNRGIDASHTPGARMVGSAFYSIKAIVNQVGALHLMVLTGLSQHCACL